MSSTKLEPKPNIRAILAIVLFAGMLFYLLVTGVMHERLENDLSEERLRSELLLSEKLSEQKENIQLKDHIKQIADKYVLTNNSLESTLEQLALREVELKRTKSLSSEALERKQKDLIKTLQEKLERDSLSNETRLNQALAYASSLEKTISDDSSERSQYLHEIERLRRPSMTEVKTEALTKSNKLTFKASRTKTIKVSLEISNQVDELSYQIINPGGNQLLINEWNSSLAVVDHNGQMPARYSVVNNKIQLNPKEIFKTVELTYTATNKLAPGIYKITLFNRQEMIGNCLLRLE